MARTKLYHLFGYPDELSARTVDYHGWMCSVAAVSIKQAYYFAGNRVWATDPEDPLGIVEIYNRGAGAPGDHQMFDGCRIYGGLGLEHGAGKSVIGRAMRAHQREDVVPGTTQGPPRDHGEVLRENPGTTKTIHL
jgi:hypothetical protein